MTPRLDRRKARATARAIADKRRHRRVELPRNARLLLENGRESPCAIFNISVGGVSAEAALAPRVNSRVVLIVEGIGRLEGRVTRVWGQRFSVYFDAASFRKRLSLADLLTWEINRGPLGLAEDRRAPRRKRGDGVRVDLADGQTRAKYLDDSEVGASFSSLQRPRPGEVARIEARIGRIARRHDKGFAIDFAPDEPSPKT
ncbi:MAG: PilZ domain-containing protein [Maricaulaceae bacterium]|jgi:hypothetical protein